MKTHLHLQEFHTSPFISDFQTMVLLRTTFTLSGYQFCTNKFAQLMRIRTVPSQLLSGKASRMVKGSTVYELHSRELGQVKFLYSNVYNLLLSSFSVSKKVIVGCKLTFINTFATKGSPSQVQPFDHFKRLAARF